MNKILPPEKAKRQQYQSEGKALYSRLDPKLKREAAVNTVISNMDDFLKHHPELEGLTAAQIMDSYYAVYRVMIVMQHINQERRGKKAIDWDINSEMQKMADKYGTTEVPGL